MLDEVPFSSISLSVREGERIGLLLRRSGDLFTANDCSRIPPEGLEDASGPPCRASGAPARPYGRRPPEPRLRYAVRPRVVGCGRAPAGDPYQLVAYRLARAGARRSTLCIDIAWLPGGPSYGCEDNRVRGGRMIDANGVARGAGQPVRVSGSADAFVAAIRVVYSHAATQQQRAGSIVHVSSRRVLRALRVRKPFAVYVAQLPAGSRPLRVEALGWFGGSLGLAAFANRSGN